jgi:hypothetical protein
MSERQAVKVAVEVWINTALLHRENPSRSDFTKKEITLRAAKEQIVPIRRPGVAVHVDSHCVANRPASPNTYCMLYETNKDHRRLFRSGDVPHPERRGGKALPDPEDVPEQYRNLLKWYEEWSKEGSRGRTLDPLLALYGSGKHIWADEHADAYVARLREGWE